MLSTTLVAEETGARPNPIQPTVGVTNSPQESTRRSVPTHHDAQMTRLVLIVDAVIGFLRSRVRKGEHMASIAQLSPHDKKDRPLPIEWRQAPAVGPARFRLPTTLETCA